MSSNIASARLFKVLLKQQIVRNSPWYSLHPITCRTFIKSTYCCTNKSDSNNIHSETLMEENLNIHLYNKKSRSLSVVEEKDKEIVDSLKQGNIYHPYKTPTERAMKILAEDVKLTMRQFVNLTTGIVLGDLELKYFPKETDIAIIGSSIVGLSIAYAIRSRFPDSPNIIIIDKNAMAPESIANLCTGTLTHQQFSTVEEIEMAKYCTEFITSFDRKTSTHSTDVIFKINYDPTGSLFLGDASNADEVVERSKILNAYNISSRLLETRELTTNFPWLKTDNLLYGNLALVNEGLFDPSVFVVGLKCKLINLGVQFVTGEVIDFGPDSGILRRLVCKLPDGSYNSIDFSRCIIAAGYESQLLLDKINNRPGVDFKFSLPMEERIRYEYCLHNENGPGLNTPITFSPDGMYFRREGISGLYVVGVTGIQVSDENIGFLDVFNEKVKPFLADRVKGYENFTLKNGWIQTYETVGKNNEVGIFGEHPFAQEILLAVGFTQYGILYGPAVGQAMMKYIFYEKEMLKPLQVDTYIQNMMKDYEQKLLEQEKREALESR